jgi:hypothetical protein
VTLGEWKRLGEFFEFRDERFDLLRGSLEGRELVGSKSYIAILAYEGVAEEQACVEPQNPDQRRSRSS